MRALLMVLAVTGLVILPTAAPSEAAAPTVAPSDAAVPTAPRGEASAGVSATLTPTTTTVAEGHRFTVRSLIRNDGSASTGPLLAHLDVVSLQNDVYVDPEDWSDSRTRPLASLAAGGSATLVWSVRAVNAGRFDVHVVVLPVLDRSAGPLAVSTPTYAEVSARRSLDPGGSLVVVLGVPVLVGAGAAGSRLRLRARTSL